MGALAGAALLVAAMPIAAQATVRFATPGGLTTGPCDTEATACTFSRSLVVGGVGDEVIVGPGSYAEGGSHTATNSQYVHGAFGQPVPAVNLTPGGTIGLGVTNNALVSRLSITVQGANRTALLIQNGSAEQVIAAGEDSGSTGCFGVGSALIRDSICWSGAANATGVGVLADGVGASTSVLLRNVTAVATSAGSVGINAEADNTGEAFVDAKNTIADGAPAGDDVAASSLDGGSTAIVALQHSNYATENEIDNGGTQSITDPGTGGNQTSAPVFANATAGNFHQLAGSPTLDAGSAGISFFGSVDIDGDARSLDATIGCSTSVAVPDIGADERVSGTPDCAAPETTIVAAPRAKTRKRRAGFTFTATEPSAIFQCSIDSRPFAPCTTPVTYSKLRRRKHMFEVRAIDAAGNIDTTPARQTWRILGSGKKAKKPKK